LSLRGRLLAASLALLTVALAVAGVATYFALRLFLLDRINHQLDSVDRNSEAALSIPGVGVRGPLLGQLLAISAPGYYVELRNAQGRALAHWQGQGEVPAPQPLLPINLEMPTQQGTPGDHTSAKYFTVPSAARGVPGYQVRVSGVTLADDGSVGALIVALPLTDVRGTLARLIGVEFLVGIALLAAAAVIGSWLVRLGLRPLAEIEGTAERIAAGDLTERVARSDDHTEVGQLGRALNVMLARIEAAFDERRASEAALRTSEERLRRFVSDASHELRTPVASVRAYAELFRRGGDRHPEDLPRLMARIESEAARMGVLVEDLLLLTRLDQGRSLEMAPVDLGALAADSVEAARTIDPERPLTLHVEGSVEVMGDRDRLRQVTDNLLTNVRTHTPPSAGASVTVRLAGGRAIIEVADSGPGIDPADTEHIFERFFRSDPSRARDRGGSGLGLSIVAAIAAAHGGSASAANRPGPGGGALFTIDLPVLVEPPAEPPRDEGTQEEGPGPEAGPQAWGPEAEAEPPPQDSGLIRT
jgi:two-component system OmpR family sensor kinase